MRLSKRRKWYSSYIPTCSRHLHAENRSSVQISEPVWQLQQSHQLPLETGQTGYLWHKNTLELNSICAKDLLEYEIRLRKWIRLPLRRMSQASTLKLTPPTNGKMNRLQCLKTPYMKGKRWSLQTCYLSCTTQPSCQTVNYNPGVTTCQLNDTKHSRPKYFVEKPVLVYA